MTPRLKRIVASVASVVVVGGSAVGLTSAGGGPFRFLQAKPPLAVKVPVSLTVRNMAAGDVAQRVVTITNQTNRTVRKMVFKVDTPTPLGRDRYGVIVRVTTCGVPWRRIGTGAPRYMCPKRRRVNVGTRRLPLKYKMVRLPATPPGGRFYFMITVKLPKNARNNLQGRSATLRPTFTIIG